MGGAAGSGVLAGQRRAALVRGAVCCRHWERPGRQPAAAAASYSSSSSRPAAAAAPQRHLVADVLHAHVVAVQVAVLAGVEAQALAGGLVELVAGAGRRALGHGGLHPHAGGARLGGGLQERQHGLWAIGGIAKQGPSGVARERRAPSASNSTRRAQRAGGQRGGGTRARHRRDCRWSGRGVALADAAPAPAAAMPTAPAVAPPRSERQGRGAPAARAPARAWRRCGAQRRGGHGRRAWPCWRSRPAGRRARGSGGWP